MQNNLSVTEGQIVTDVIEKPRVSLYSDTFSENHVTICHSSLTPRHLEASELLRELGQAEVTLTPNGARLEYAAPAGCLTSEHRAAIRYLKQELLDLLNEVVNIPEATETPVATTPPAPNAIWNAEAGIWLHPSGLWRYYTPSPGVAQVQTIRRKHVGILQAAERSLLPPGPCPLAAGMGCSDPTQAVLGIAAMLGSIMQSAGGDQRDLSADETGQLEEADAALLTLSAAWQETGWEVPAIEPTGTDWSAPAPVHQLAFDNAA